MSKVNEKTVQLGESIKIFNLISDWGSYELLPEHWLKWILEQRSHVLVVGVEIGEDSNRIKHAISPNCIPWASY